MIKLVINNLTKWIKITLEMVMYSVALKLQKVFRYIYPYYKHLFNAKEI